MPIKIGDRVRVVDYTEYDFRRGQTGVVTVIKSDRILVLMDDLTYHSLGDDKEIQYKYWFPLHKLEIIE